jgi:hypothetical protein
MTIASLLTRASVRCRRGLELPDERRATRLRLEDINKELGAPSFREGVPALSGRPSEGWDFAIVSALAVRVNTVYEIPAEIQYHPAAMTTRVTIVLLLAAIAGLAQELAPSMGQMPPAEQDRFVGMWKANLEKSQPPLSREEATYSRKFSRIGNVLLSSSEEAKRKWQNKYQCDGNHREVQHGLIVICEYKSPSAIVGVTRMGPEFTYWTWELSSDALQLIVKYYSDAERTKVSKVRVFDRIN